MSSRFRFSLRALLVATALVGCGAGFFVRWYLLEKWAEAQLKKSGLTVWSEPDPDTGRVYKSVSSWQMVSDHFFILNEVSDVDLAPLRYVNDVEYVALSGQRITNDGLAHIAHMRSLKELSLDGTNITGRGLERLQIVAA